MQVQEMIQWAKEKLLSDGYGKYDLIEKLLTQEELLQEKPRILRERISVLLQLDIGDIPYRTFLSWLHRVRKKAGDLKGTERTAAKIRQLDPIVGVSGTDEQAGDDDWKKFKPTDISTLKREEEPILKQYDFKT
jgi:hypothetical protein